MNKPHKKIKLLLFTNSFYPKIGGVEKVIMNLIKKLNKKGFQITVITKKYDASLSDFEVMNGAKIHRVSVLVKNKVLKMIYIWKWIIKNRKIILDSDIWQFHDVTPFLWIIPLLSFKKPLFMIFHGYESFPIKIKFKVLRWILSKIVDDYACVSKSLENYYPVKSRNVFYNGTKGVISNSKKTKEICFVSRIEEDTYLIKYLKSLLYLKTKYGLNLKLDVYGDGELKKECEEFMRKNNLRVQFFGQVPNADRFMKKYRYAFVTQTFSTVEAMANRCLIFNISPNRFKKDFANEILLGGACGIIASDYQSLGDKLFYYSTHKKEYDKVVQEAANRAKNFTWDKVVKNLFIPLYTKLLKNL